MEHNHFINKHTAFSVILLILACLYIGYYVGKQAGYNEAVATVNR